MSSVGAVSADRRAGLTRRTRAASLGAVAVLHGGLFYALLHGLGEQVMPQAAGPAVIAYDVPPPSPSPTPPLPPPPPPPPPSPEPQVRRSEPAKAPAPPAPKATPRAGTVPEPRLILVPEAPPVPRATGSGSDAGAGAAESGSGSGAGGVGSGGGAGGPGGEGAGAGVLARRAEKIAGELKARDFPRSGAADRNGRAIVVRYQVGADGRVRQCRVTQSSGNAEVDAITCRLIEQRFRYRPALDRLGRPMADETGWKQWWWQ